MTRSTTRSTIGTTTRSTLPRRLALAAALLVPAAAAW